MRIQHNITAMNAYRNYTNNSSAVAKNLEKLSSGYKINRAGDDAAGLAISEKMRAQITGLDVAKKNAKDGISLVQTAEGALTEVHDMLNRMYELSEQSANGTYADDVDRANLQKEITSLKTEIDRIADSANFNGINLLDGSLSSSGAPGKNGSLEADLSKLGLDLTLSATDVKAVQGGYTTNDFADDTGIADGDKFEFTVNFTDADGKQQSVTKTLFIKDATTTDIWLDDGSEEGVRLTANSATAGTITADEFADAFAEALSKDDTVKSNFTVAASGTGDGLTLTARAAGSDGAVLNSVTSSKTVAAGTTTTHATKVDVTAKPIDATKAYSLTGSKVWGSTDATNGTKDLKDSIFEINGKKFAFVQQGALSDDQLAELREAGVDHWVNVAADTGVAAADVTSMVEKIKKETGLDVEQGTNSAAGAWTGGATGTSIIFKPSATTADGDKKGGLTLQIGDTAESFNQLTVSVNDMHAKAMGIEDVDISNQKGAAAAMSKLKDAVNYVSETRGDLGATQNRLEHTINNLSVMQENIQDAESSIRDVDVAEEMMAYTKNNILVQSAQAMLAQANQLPQGVLQLLQ